MEAIFGSGAAGSEGEFPNAGDSARKCEEGSCEAEDDGVDYSRMCRYHPLTVEVLCRECGGEGICEHAEDSSVCRQCRPITEAGESPSVLSMGDGVRVDRITGDGARQSVPQDCGRHHEMVRGEEGD
eukprot:687372-Rhodomonas_salina.1